MTIETLALTSPSLKAHHAAARKEAPAMADLLVTYLRISDNLVRELSALPACNLLDELEARASLAVPFSQDELERLPHFIDQAGMPLMAWIDERNILLEDHHHLNSPSLADYEAQQQGH
jgi:hypothetical protein